MLSIATVMFPPCAVFVQVWGLTSLASMAMGLLRQGLVQGQRRYRWTRVLKFMNRSVRSVQKTTAKIFAVVTRIKEWIIERSAQVADVLFDLGEKAWTKVVQPAVAAVVRKTKSAFAGFLGWASGLFRRPGLA